MFFKHLAVGPMMANCFILGDENTGEAVVIDPGGDADSIAFELDRAALTLTGIVLTHGHWDHTAGAAELKRLAGGRLLIHASGDSRGLGADGLLVEGDGVRFGEHSLKVLETPGHSPDGISLYLAEAEVVFSGDLLFAGSVGRTDMPGGNMEVLRESVRDKIFTLPKETTVLPGHGPMTTVEQERQLNPFLGSLE
jgi:glyoxylase-like metal-dependent hydrolase (beta-lactamase superfamily II)